MTTGKSPSPRRTGRGRRESTYHLILIRVGALMTATAYLPEKKFTEFVDEGVKLS